MNVSGFSLFVDSHFMCCYVVLLGQYGLLIGAVCRTLPADFEVAIVLLTALSAPP